MDYSGQIGSMNIVYQPVVDPQVHKPVYKAVIFAGESGTFTVGEMLAFDASGNAVSYDPDSGTSTATVVGVLAEPVDASGTDDVPAQMLWHGAVKRGMLTVEGGAPTAAEFGALENTNRIFLV